jgi:4-amino-4-deoxy-L-arabinose transferase-like glycosyltransferase
MVAFRRAIATLPRWLVLSIGAAAFAVLFGLPNVIAPLATDQVLYSLGARTILHGGQLYKDFWEIKPPLVFLIYALPFAIAGEHMEAIRVLDLLNTLVAMAGVFLLTRRFFGERAGVFAAAFYAFTYLTWMSEDGLAEAEAFMAAPLVFAFYAYRADDEDSSYPRAAVAGVLLGLAFALKSTAFLFLLGLPAAELLLRGDNWSRGGALGRLGLALGGFAIVQLAFALYLAAGGALSDFIDIQRNYTAHYNAYRFAPEGVSHTRFLFDGTSAWVRNVPFLLVPAASALLFALFRPKHTAAVWLFALLAALGVAAIWWQGKMFDYHWIMLVPLLAPLAGFAVDQLGTLLAALPSRRALIGWLVIAAGLVALASQPLLDTYDDYRLLVRYAGGDVTRRDVEAHYLPLNPANHEVVDYVRANSGPDDRLFVFGLWPQTYFWLDRPLVDRFDANHGLRATWAPQKWRNELMRDLRANPPRYFAIGLGDRQPWLVGTAQTSDEFVRDNFPELRTFLVENYDLVQNFGPMVLLERKPVPV